MSFARSYRPAEGDAVTLGVEEEFLVVDALDGRPVPGNARLLDVLDRPWAGEPANVADRHAEQAAATGSSAPATAGTGAGPAGSATGFEAELLASMIETVSPVRTDLGGLREVLAAGRARLGRAAAESGLRVLAIGSPVTPPAVPRTVSAKARYGELRDLYGLLVTQQETCGLHVHVGVADREMAVAVVNRLRPWLPTLLAISVNSPFCDGADTGYASWRTVALSRWPATDIPPHFSSAAHYDQVTAMLHRSGALVPSAHPYWLARPSARFPTVELRAADVAATVDEAVLQAALSRALVRTACAELAAGEDTADLGDTEILRAALWAAARFGLNGDGVHPRTGGGVPATALVDEMLDRIRPALRETGDEEEVDRLLTALARTGTGAERQRALLAPDTGRAGAARLIEAFDIGTASP
ncbi:carboxylate-amine ligase [Sphaerisporangium sp. NPDC004334]